MLKKIFVVLLASTPLAALAQEPKRMSSTNVVKATATVQSVDEDTRSMVLRSPEGARTLVVAGPEVRNFEQIEAGDRVVATYREAVLAEVLPKGTQAAGEPRASVSKSQSASGERPAAAVTASVSSDVVIDSISPSYDEVTFKGSDGVARTVAVESPKATQFLRNLKPGSEVRVTYTEATAMAVTPAP